LRESDIVCRWGGEEFLVVLKHCDLDAAWQLAEKIRTTIERETVVWGVEKISVQGSLGVVQRHSGESIDQLLARADQALYRAKHLGRNRAEKDAD
jgi:diguanylate cyclase (GGDEF)-like protein